MYFINVLFVVCVLLRVSFHLYLSNCILIKFSNFMQNVNINITLYLYI